MAFLAAWLFLGSVSHSRAVDGIVAEPASGDSLQLLVWAGNDNAASVGAGLPATVELTTADGSAHALKGDIVSVSAVFPVQGLAVPVSMYLVDVTIHRNLETPIPAGIRCRIVIELARQSPFSCWA